MLEGTPLGARLNLTPLVLFVPTQTHPGTSRHLHPGGEFGIERSISPCSAWAAYEEREARHLRARLAVWRGSRPLSSMATETSIGTYLLTAGLGLGPGFG